MILSKLRYFTGIESLQQPGKSDGQIMMVKREHVVEAHSVSSSAIVFILSYCNIQWSAANNSWTMLGVVSDAKDTQPPPGWQYFDIELDGKKMICKHKKGENPYMTAQKYGFK